MALPKKKKQTVDLEEAIRKLRSTEKWKRYYDKIILGSELEKSPFKSEEEAKKYIDKLVLIPMNSKNPFETFDDFWKGRKKKK